jgi:predicted nucleic acid-binding protein
MPKTIISDTGCLIVFSNIGELDLLQKTYSQITTTIEVTEEYGKPLPN